MLFIADAWNLRVIFSGMTRSQKKILSARQLALRILDRNLAQRNVDVVAADRRFVRCKHGEEATKCGDCAAEQRLDDYRRLMLIKESEIHEEEVTLP